MRQPATYQEIQKWVEQQYGFTPKTCWIAHCKEIHGLSLGTAPNRHGEDREQPCPPEKQPAIYEGASAFRDAHMSTTIIARPAEPQLPALIAGTGDRAALRFLEFSTVNIRNRNTRAAYAR